VRKHSCRPSGRPDWRSIQAVKQATAVLAESRFVKGGWITGEVD
jgi:hypothetical protein